MTTMIEIRTLARAVRLTWPRWQVRQDIPRAFVSGRWQSWRERLNRAVFAARSWECVETMERRHARELAARAVRCSVYQERAGVSGRAVFN